MLTHAIIAAKTEDAAVENIQTVFHAESTKTLHWSQNNRSYIVHNIYYKLLTTSGEAVLSTSTPHPLTN